MVNCDKCGRCCSIFYIPLTEDEYFSGKFKLMFNVVDLEFSEIEKNGWNLLKRENNKCVYLKDNKCSIHSDKPKHCQDFFCKDPNANKAMVKEIEKFNKT